MNIDSSKTALKYPSIDFIQSSIEVIMSTDSFSFSSETCRFAFSSSFLGSLIAELNMFCMSRSPKYCGFKGLIVIFRV
jgi:hypothetical protein